MVQVGERLEALERRTQELTERLARLEGAPRGGWAPPHPAPAPHAVPRPVRPPAPAPAPAPDPAPPVPRPPAPRLEDVLGGRVLAWAGGVAVLVAIVLFFTIAVSRGWIGEAARTALGGLLAAGLVAAGAWLHERRDRSDAARAAVAAGVGGLFATVVVAGRLYALVPVAGALAGAVAVGALATLLALRWDSPGVAALGVVGGLAAPLALGAPGDPATLALLLAAGVAAAVVVARRRWAPLAAAASLVLAVQWGAFVAFAATDLAALGVLVAFGALATVLATAAGPVLAAALLALDALLLAGLGWPALDAVASRAVADGWLCALAVAHLAGAAALRARASRASRAGVVPLALATLGVVLADVALARLLDGVALGVAWSAVAVGFAALLGRVRAAGPAGPELALAAGLTAQVGVAAGHALLVGAPPALLDQAGPAGADPVASLVALGAGLVAAGELVGARPHARLALHGLATAAVGYLLALLLDGPALAAAWAAGGALRAGVAARPGRPRLPAPALAGAGALAAAALAHALLAVAPAAALVGGVADPLGALVALGAAAGAFAAIAAAAAGAELRRAAAAVAALALLHLASVLLVTAAGAGEQAQALLSALWAAAGVAALVAGLARDVAPLRAGALALLLAALGKVFLYDLATLDAMARVASFLALGLLLLLGAFVHARLRPPAAGPRH